MNIKNKDLLYLNAVCGALFLVMASLLFGPPVVSVGLTFFALFLFVGGLVSENYKLNNNMSYIQSSYFGEEQWAYIGRMSSFGILALNIVAYMLLWFFPPLPSDEVAASTIVFFVGGYFLIVLYLDYGRLGREMTRRRFRNQNQE